MRSGVEADPKKLPFCSYRARDVAVVVSDQYGVLDLGLMLDLVTSG